MSYKTLYVKSLFIFVAILASVGCNDQKFSMLEYYFPLDEIESSKVYMYQVETDQKGTITTDTSYLQIGKIVDGKYFFLTLDKDLVSKDSSIIMIVDGAIISYQLFLIQDGAIFKGVEENQTIYPAKVALLETYTTNHTLKSIVVNDIYTNATNIFSSQIMERNDTAVVVNMITKTYLKAVQGKAEHNFHETARIVNKKGVGMVSWSTLAEESNSERTLIGILNPQEWNDWKQKRQRLPVLDQQPEQQPHMENGAPHVHE